MAAALDNSARFDLGSWTANWTAFNATQYVPSAKDLAMAGPRMFMKLGSFLAVPEAVDNIFGARAAMGQRIIPEATGGAGAGFVQAATTSAAEIAQAATEILVDADEEAVGLASKFSLESARSFGNVFSYMTSRWAVLCVIMAVVLNRTSIYASVRRNLVLPWKVRFAIRMIPIVLLAFQARYLLQSIQCQTSPDFSMLRWGNASKHSDLMFTQDGGMLHTLSSALLFGASDEQSCLAVKMIPPVYDEEVALSDTSKEKRRREMSGSLSLLYPLFQTFCFSQFTEAVSCAAQGRQVAAETGMSIFEHSLAFAEAEAAVGTQLGFGTFGGTKTVRAWANTSSSDEAQEIAITRNMIMKRVNTTPEVLLVGFLSAMNHITSHILAIFNYQGRLRLLNTGLWGLTFMLAIGWSIISFDLDDIFNQPLLRFPTVCIVGFIPHVLVLCGIVCCMLIYGAALFLSALAPPSQEGTSELEPDTQSRSFMRRLRIAHHNMQANVPLSNIRITMHMDFYSALLRTGFSVMTMASEAVYLNESRGVNIKQRTWLEEDRLREIEEVGPQWLGPSFRANHGSNDGWSDSVGLVAVKDQPVDILRDSSSGYAREMTAKKKTPMKGTERSIRDGVGAAERSGRWIMALEFFVGIIRLLASWYANLTLKLLAKLGIETRPRFLLWLVRRPKKGGVPETPRQDENDPDSLQFWMLNPSGELELPKDEHVDVEAEVRNRLRNNQESWNDADEKKLESHLYGWWLSGGWWGGDDSSGTFNPAESEIDEDTTSVVSFSTTAEDQEQDWESDNDDGRRTPTRHNPYFSREETPITDTPLEAADLAQLLHPQTPEQRAEAQALAAHFSSDTIMTRSRYRNLTQRQRTKVLTSTLLHRPPNFSPASNKLAPDEEAQILEHLILTRRANAREANWEAGEGDGGPVCVVCQSSPRSIIVWPCRCLSLCDDCRVTLAMNNFDKCVCCRRDVGSFSRIFVP